MTVTWCCPECVRPVTLHPAVEEHTAPNGTVTVAVDVSLAVRVHLDSHERD